MTRKELLREIEALPLKERVQLQKDLERSVHEGRLRIHGIFSGYRDAMREITGIDVVQRRRFHDLVIARSIVADRLHRDGFHDGDIAACLGLDRSTIYHCRTVVSDMLEAPRFYRQELEVYKQFKQITQ